MLLLLVTLLWMQMLTLMQILTKKRKYYIFQELLKGKEAEIIIKYFYIILAGMTNSAIFNDIELFWNNPSSNCNVNEDLYSFMDQIRCLKEYNPKRKYPEVYKYA